MAHETYTDDPFEEEGLPNHANPQFEMGSVTTGRAPLPRRCLLGSHIKSVVPAISRPQTSPNVTSGPCVFDEPLSHSSAQVERARFAVCPALPYEGPSC